MNIFKKIGEFFALVFGIECKEKEEPVEEKKVEEPIKEETSVEEELIPEEATRYDEEDSKEEPIIEEKSVVEYEEFSCELKNQVADIIRPVIKGLNDDIAYLNACTSNNIESVRVLKTFLTISEDKKSLNLKLTQNEEYNKFLANTIMGYLNKLIAPELTKVDSKFESIEDSENSIIIIRKIK